MNMKEIARTAHAVGQNCFHMIWAPKYRYPVFKFPNYRQEMEIILRDTAQRHNIVIHELCVESDHIHLFVELPPTLSVSGAFQIIKGGSSYAFRNKHPMLRKYRALWSIGKFYRSVGAVTDVAIQRYINDSHHITKVPKSQRRLN